MKVDRMGLVRKYIQLDVGCRSKDYFTLVKSNQLHVNPFVHKETSLAVRKYNEIYVQNLRHLEKCFQ